MNGSKVPDCPRKYRSTKIFCLEAITFSNLVTATVKVVVTFDHIPTSPLFSGFLDFSVFLGFSAEFCVDDIA